MRKMSFQSFLIKAQQVHNTNYDYSSAEFVDSKTKIEVICRKHGAFMQVPYAHLRGQGCPSCAKNTRVEKISLPFSDFLQRARRVHGTKYRYIEESFSNGLSLMRIICQFHGEFTQKPNVHLRGSGCQDCAREKSKKNLPTKNIKQIRDTKGFEKAARDVHGDRYSYEKVRFQSKHAKVVVICSEHGEFTQSPNNHLRGSGCPKCGTQDAKNKIMKSREQFIYEAQQKHNYFYDYEKVKYEGKGVVITIVCPIHGDFTQVPAVHLYNGAGCPKCAIEIVADVHRYTTEDFIRLSKLVHGDRYDYKESCYERSRNKIKIICQEHGEFYQSPNHHLRGYGCQVCGKNNSYMASQWLDECGVPKEHREVTIKLPSKKRYRVDALYDNVVYEFNGDFWHGNPKIYNSGDVNPIAGKSFGELHDKTMKKENDLKKFGFKVVSIWEKDYKEKLCRKEC